jgi:hypothetical protein
MSTNDQNYLAGPWNDSVNKKSSKKFREEKGK